MTSTLAAAVDLNGPGHYLHWSVFTVSVANLSLIAVMIVIFGLALYLPFPKGAPDEPPSGSVSAGEPAAAGADTGPVGWTGRVRRRLVAWLPPDKLLPDRQPAYVRSWIYVFGVGSLAALGMTVASGVVLALGGPDWWHTDSFGHFVNSVHLWSVELFMALLVIHLWGKFWMAAWRGRRAATWITGVAAFMISVAECFTGYVSQQNFDSQWIATNGKDAFNSVGVGAWFNVMNFGQMLMWHIVLVPLALFVVVGVHILLVRIRGVVHPLPRRGALRRSREERRAQGEADARPWTGPTRRYDIVKEGAGAVAVVTALTLVLAGILSSPDVPSLTIRTWSRLAPADFMATAANELAGTTETAQYGPPYNGASDSVQRFVIGWQQLAGIRQRIDAPRSFVLTPLTKVAGVTPGLAAALDRYQSAPESQQAAWNKAYLAAIEKVRFVNGAPVLPGSAGAAGPVPVLIANELALARSGGLDADLVSDRAFYGTNFTKPLLFIEDGSYFAAQAEADHLLGEQWGVMNETGSYPGQPWLWLYQLWYQVPGVKSSPNVDVLAVYLTGGATLLLLAVPFLPGLRDIPRLVPVHRWVWKDRAEV